MRFNITGKNYAIGDHITATIEKKLSRLGKYFTEDTEARIRLERIKDREKIEVTIPTKLGQIRAEDEGRDILTSIDNVAESIERQITRYKKKIIDKKQNVASFSDYFMEEEFDTTEDDAIRIEKIKHFAMKPMDPEEACLQMEMLGHSFYMFLNAETGQVNVVYKRKSGTYGLIEPEL